MSSSIIKQRQLPKTTFFTSYMLSVVINFYFHFFNIYFLSCGDIEVKPGPTSENIIDILHLNIRSIMHKLGLSNSLIHDFDILCFTETHLDILVSNDNVLLDGFNNIIRKDRNCWGWYHDIFVKLYSCNKTPRFRARRSRMHMD